MVHIAVHALYAQQKGPYYYSRVNILDNVIGIIYYRAHLASRQNSIAAPLRCPETIIQEIFFQQL